MTEFDVVQRYQELEHRAEDLQIKIFPMTNAFFIQTKQLKVLSTPTTLDGIAAFLDAVEYAGSKNFKGF